MKAFISDDEKLENKTKQDLELLIEQLSTLPAIEYDRVRRDHAKELGIQLKTLDEAVKLAKAKSGNNDDQNPANSNLLFQEITLWPERVDIKDLLLELVMIFDRFAILPRHSAVSLALWVCFSWCIDAASTAPILAIISPEKRCGKTTVLSLLKLLVKRPLPAANITAAALFRTIEEFKPTLLIDEADTFLRQSDDLRGILNSGHTRSTAYVLRTVGDDHKPKAFNTWGAKAIALIGKLPDTLHDRSIVIQLKRKLPGEKTERLHRTEYNFEIVRSKLARYAEDNQLLIKKQPPTKIANSISDRAADNWETLLAIAKLAGEEFEALAINTMTALTDNTTEPQTYGIALLADIKEIFDRNSLDRISSGELIALLCQDEEKPWKSFKHGNSINQRNLAHYLGEFSIASKNIRINSQILKGYEIEQFSESFSRYLATTPNLSVTPLQTNIINGFEENSYPLQSVAENLSVTPNSVMSNGCNGVTDKLPENIPLSENVEHNTDNSYFEDTYSSVTCYADYYSGFNEADYYDNLDFDYDNNCSNYSASNYNPDSDEVDDYLNEERAAIMEYDGGFTREEAEMAIWGRVISARH